MAVDVGTATSLLVRLTAPHRSIRYGVFSGPHRSRRWRPVKTIERVRWLDAKLHVYRDRVYSDGTESPLWWVRCDACLSSYRKAYTLSRTHAGAVRAGVRHALVVHQVVL